MRLIFLDFDGVLHEARGDLEEGQYLEWLPILAALIAPYDDVQVVVHSSWRHMLDAGELGALMRGLAGRYLGVVPAGPRERAIREYLRIVPHVRDYLVLDDTPTEFSKLRGRRLLICHPQTGLSDLDVQRRLKAWLDGMPKQGDSDATLRVAPTGAPSRNEEEREASRSLLPAEVFRERMRWSERMLGAALASKRVFADDVNGEPGYPTFLRTQRWTDESWQRSSGPLPTCPVARS